MHKNPRKTTEGPVTGLQLQSQEMMEGGLKLPINQSVCP